MLFFLIENKCRHLVNENDTKRDMINFSPIQVSKPPALQHVRVLVCPSEIHFDCSGMYVCIFFSTEILPTQFLDLAHSSTQNWTHPSWGSVAASGGVIFKMAPEGIVYLD